MNDNRETESYELDNENNTPIEPCDEFPGTFFRVPLPPNLHDTWSLS
jgi:hypothetical protein